jgi:UDP-glucuronate 4-epimerase
MDGNMRSVLITGGAGFIGSHLVDLLLAEGGWLVTVLDNFDPFYDRSIKEENIAPHRNDPRFRLVEADLLAPDLDDRIGTERFDVIVHLAAKAGVRPSIDDPCAYLQVNVVGTQRLMDYARRSGVQRFILASSSSVYGECPNVPWKEAEQALLPISPYAASKLAAEQLAHIHSRLHGLHTTVLRFFTVYGPRQRPDLAIHQFTGKILSGLPIRQFGDGTTQRDYTYIEDIIAGVRAAMERSSGQQYEVYNLGNSSTVALSELIKALEQELRTAPVIERFPEQPGDVPRTFADVTKAGSHLDFVPRTPLQVGLSQFCSWYGRRSNTSYSVDRTS